MKKILPTLIFLGILSLNAQIRVKLVDPSDNTVVLHNYGGTTIDVSTYWFCNFPAYAAINGMSINSGSTNLAPDEEVSITSSINFDPSDAEFGLYTTNTSNFINDMVDYLQWGSSGHQREPVAVAAGIWNADTFISVDPPFEYTGTGSENGISNWETFLSSEDFKINNFSMSPNPTSSLLTLKFPKNIDKGTLNIYNTLGEVILSKIFSSSNTLQIDVSNFSQGIYLVKINNQTKRFIKQ